MINVIDKDKCTGCGTCFKSCSLDVFRIDTDQDSRSPCMVACPAGTDIRGYNALVQQGRLEEAAHVLLQKNPFPAVTGRVCFRPCEKQCARNNVDDAVNINALEQFLGDLPVAEEAPAIRHVARVGVIGSGPAGLSCAWYLARMGYAVTVFEEQAQPGGMLRYGIPAYRLPDAIIERQVRRLEAAGVRFSCSTKVGKGGDVSLETLRMRGYKAFLLAPGASLSRKISVPGIELPGVLWGVEFLRAVRGDTPPALHGKVVVVGGGDVAIDTAISAKRLGADSVCMVALESEAELPAYPHNQADAREEGIVMHCGWGPVRVEGEAAVRGLTVQRCLAVRDAQGAFCPSFDSGQTMTLEADTIILAIGQTPELLPFDDEISVTRRNTIETQPVTFATSGRDIFAAGDAATGPASVIQAIAGGREAAFSIDRLLRGAQLEADRAVLPPLVENLPGEGIMQLPRNARPRREAAAFEEHKGGLTVDGALAEGMRCMTCGAKARIAYNDDCMTCYTCELRCPSGAIDVHPFKEPLPRTLEISCEER